MASLTRFASSNAKGKSKTVDEDMAEARRRLSDLDPETIPKNISQVTFDKGSGEGNKRSTHAKARLQTPLDKLLPLIPKPLHEGIRNHRNYAKKSDSLVFISEEGKKQKENREACFRKQYTLLQELGKDSIPPEKNASFFSRSHVPYGEIKKWSAQQMHVHGQKVRKERNSLRVQEQFEAGRQRKRDEITGAGK